MTMWSEGWRKRLSVPLPPPPPCHSEPFAVAQRRERAQHPTPRCHSEPALALRNLLFCRIWKEHHVPSPAPTTLSFRAVRSRAATRTRVEPALSEVEGNLLSSP